MSVDERAGWTPPAANVTTPTSLIFSENKGMVSLDSIRKSNLEASNLENLVAVFGMLLCVILPRRLCLLLFLFITTVFSIHEFVKQWERHNGFFCLFPARECLVLCLLGSFA